MLGVGRDKDDVSRREVRHAARPMKLHVAFHDDQRFRLAGMNVRVHVLVGFGGYLT